MLSISFMKEKNHIATIFFIGVIVWAISNTGHEIVGHGLTCVLLGYKPLGVSTSFFLYDEVNVSFWDNKMILMGGTFFNLCLAAISYFLLKKQFLERIHTKYFFWVLMSLNLFYSGSYIAGWFIGPTLDSALLLKGFESQIMLKSIFTLLGLGLIFLGFRASSSTLGLIVDTKSENLGKNITSLTFYPYLAAIVIKMSAGLMNQSGDKMLILLGSFGATGVFLVWINFVRFWKISNSSTEAVLSISKNTKWIVSGLVVMGLYVYYLGSGIGQIR